MKKLILMTSALTLLGGAATAAEITISATAGVTYGNWDPDYSSTGTLGNAAVLDEDGTGDGGQSAGLALSGEIAIALEGMANGVTYGGDFTVDVDADEVSQGVVYVAGTWGKVSFGADEFDELSSDDPVVGDGTIDAGDIKYEGSFGALSTVVVLDVDDTDSHYVEVAYAGDGFNFTASDLVDLDDDVTTIGADFTFSGVTIGASAGDDDTWDAYVSSTFGGVGVKVSADESEVVTLDLSGDTGSFSWTAQADSDGETAATLGTSFGDTSVDLSYDSDANYFDGNEYDSDDAVFMIAVSHTVGGLTLSAKANENEDYEVGASASFEF